MVQKLWARCVKDLVFLRGGVCLFAGPALRLWLDRPACRYSAQPRWSSHCGAWTWALEAGMVHTYSLGPLLTHSPRLNRTTRVKHTRRHWWTHSQNVLESNQLHVLCRLYAGWPFGLASPADWKHVMWLLGKVVPTSLLTICQTRGIVCSNVLKFFQQEEGIFLSICWH